MPWLMLTGAVVTSLLKTEIPSLVVRAHTSKLESQVLTGGLGDIYSGIELCLQPPYAFQISG